MDPTEGKILGEENDEKVIIDDYDDIIVNEDEDEDKNTQDKNENEEQGEAEEEEEECFDFDDDVIVNDDVEEEEEGNDISSSIGLSFSSALDSFRVSL